MTSLPTSASFWFTLIFFACLSRQSYAQSPMTQEEVRAVAQQWYAQHSAGYYLTLDPEEASTNIESIFQRSTDKQDRLIMQYQGMRLVLVFNQDLRTIEWTQAAFDEHFAYLTLTDIPLGIPVFGWTLNPRVPTSSAGKEMITFHRIDKEGLAFTINWETYTVGGYSENEFCKRARQWTDTPTPEGCLVFEDKRVPLQLDVTVAKP